MSKPYRSSLVITQPRPGEAVQHGDYGFESAVRQHYEEEETVALERLFQLKNILNETSDDNFWYSFCNGVSKLVDAQYAIVSKRLPDSPAVGEAGSCLMALCWFYDNGHGIDGSSKNIKYHAYSCPCSLMSHKKVLLVPERLNETFPENPNKLSFPAEAYLALPLFDGDDCFAHFGLLWTEEALQRRRLGWGFIELLCHALEDIVLQRFLSGAEFPEESRGTTPEAPAIPFETIAALHSLKPFARNLSHELRTPMQGIVGMLDIMYATIHDGIQSSTSPEVAQIFEELRENLETIQASAKRAIEASDNVVQAYALNMGLPDLPLPTRPVDASIQLGSVRAGSASQSPQPRGIKRSRKELGPHDIVPPPAKRVVPHASHEAKPKDHLTQAVSESERLTRSDKYSPSLLFSANSGLESVGVRDFISFVVQESLKASSSSYVGPPTTDGPCRRVEVEVTLSNGSKKSKTVEWIIRPSVPEFVLVDERMLAKIISCVFQNALKFTESGTIRLVARFCLKRKYLIISCKDSGPGLDDNFKQKIFKPFAREDDSTTRQNEGLGLGLLVAKGLSRKLGGDLLLISSDTSGDNKGCEFEMRIPISPTGLTNHGGVTGVADDTKEIFLYPSISSSTAPGTNTTPPSPPPTTNTRSSSSSFPSNELSTDDNLTSGQNLPHSPPPSPCCLTCNMTETHPCPPTLLGTSPADLKSNVPPELDAISNPAQHFAIPDPPSQLPQKTMISRRTSQLFDRDLATTHPLTFLVAEDNPVNRKLLVSMLTKLGYDPKTQIYEAYDGVEAVRKVQAAYNIEPAEGESNVKGHIDVVLMDLWMPAMDGYEATERILAMFRQCKPSTVRTMSAPDSFQMASPKTTSGPPSVERTMTSRFTASEINPVREGNMGSRSSSSRSSRDGNAGSTTDGLSSREHHTVDRACHIDAGSTTDRPSSREHRTVNRACQMVAPTILAVTADATDGALQKAKSVGMEGFMVKPFRVKDLEKLIKEGWERRERGVEARRVAHLD